MTDRLLVSGVVFIVAIIVGWPLLAIYAWLESIVPWWVMLPVAVLAGAAAFGYDWLTETPEEPQ